MGRHEKKPATSVWLFFLWLVLLRAHSVNVHRGFVCNVFASKETLNEEKSSFCIRSTWLSFVVSEVIIATALVVAVLKPNRLNNRVVRKCTTNVINTWSPDDRYCLPLSCQKISEVANQRVSRDSQIEVCAEQLWNGSNVEVVSRRRRWCHQHRLVLSRPRLLAMLRL